MMPDRLLEDKVDLPPEERQESWHRDNLWELSSSDALWGYALRMMVNSNDSTRSLSTIL